MTSLSPIGPERDEITIENFFTFDTLTSIVIHDDKSIDIQFRFMIKDFDELSIAGSLFNEGQKVHIRSAVLTRMYPGKDMVLIRSIRLIKTTLFWECHMSTES